MPNSVPAITDEQRREALAKAIETRRMHSAIKNAVRDRTKTFEWALSCPDAKNIRVKQLLMAVPGIGNVKADKMLEAAHVARNRRVKGLGCNQRAALIELVEEFC